MGIADIQWEIKEIELEMTVPQYLSFTFIFVLE